MYLLPWIIQWISFNFFYNKTSRRRYGEFKRMAGMYSRRIRANLTLFSSWINLWRDIYTNSWYWLVLWAFLFDDICVWSLEPGIFLVSLNCLLQNNGCSVANILLIENRLPQIFQKVPSTLWIYQHLWSIHDVQSTFWKIRGSPYAKKESVKE